MKICFLTNLYGRWGRGGAEKIVAILAQAAREAGHESIVVCLKPLFAKTPLDDDERVFYLPSFYFYLHKWPKCLRLLWHLCQIHPFSNNYRLKALWAREKVDIVMTHNLTGLGFKVGSMAQKMKLPHIHWLHDAQLLHPSGLLMYKKEKRLNGFAAKIYQKLTCSAIGLPHAIISPSAWILSEHEKRGFFRSCATVVLRNPLTLFNVGKKSRRSDFIFLYAGQLVAHKGVELLLAAFADFLTNESKPLAKLLIAGDGPLWKKLNNRPLPRVELRGRVSSLVLRELMSEADCLVVPSLCYENAPGVIYEAAAAHLPVIASNLGGIKELVNDHYCFAPTVEKLSQKLNWAYEHRDDLTPPKNHNITAKEYWQKIEEIIK